MAAKGKSKTTPGGDAAGELPADIAKMTFEEAIGELEEIVGELEEGSGDLDRAIQAYERGALLKRHCEAALRAARMRVEKIVLGANGDPAALEPDDD